MFNHVFYLVVFIKSDRPNESGRFAPDIKFDVNAFWGFARVILVW